MCVHKEVAHVLYLLLHQPIEESDTAGGDSAVQDTHQKLKPHAPYLNTAQVLHASIESNILIGILTYANASKMVKRRLFL